MTTGSDGSTIYISDVSRLAPHSNVRVDVQCPRCLNVRTVKRQDVTKVGHTYCMACAKQRKLDGMVGQGFGMLTVLRLGDGRYSSGRMCSTFVCKCECGNTVERRASSIYLGHTRSCGCAGRGENHWHYRDDLTDGERDATQRKRAALAKSKWHADVLRRDNYTCVKCGRRGGKLHVHHIESFASAPELRDSVSNGATVCPKCHRLYHKWNGGNIAPATRDSFDLFIIGGNNVHS